MSDPIPVLVNRAGGTAAARGDALADELDKAFADAGLAIDLKLLEGAEIRKAARALSNAPMIVVGGGDGTLGCVAEVLADTDAALGVLPLGTRNHLARELGIPMDIPGAVAVIAAGKARQVDLGCVNGHIFVNNASVGFYPLLVRWRDAERRRRGVPKWVAVIPAAFGSLKRLPHHRLRLAMPSGTHEVKTPMLFVGNNRYQLEAGRMGQRIALDDGTLSVFAVATRSRLGLIGFALRAVVGLADPESDFAAIDDVVSLTVTGESEDVEVALDGEVMRLSMPLEFSIRPGVLKVIAPDPDADLSKADASPKSRA